MFKAFQRPSVCRVAAALALVSTTPPALAATGVAKSEAILGAPSQLAAILAAQQGFEAPKPVDQTLFVQAASHFSAHRPDVFGSVALAVRRTPLDQRWHRRRAASRPRIGSRIRLVVARKHANSTGSMRSIATSTTAFNSKMTPASTAATTSGLRPATRCAAAAATARIMRSPSCRCCAPPESRTATST